MTTIAPSNGSTLRVYLRQSIGEDRNTHGIDAQRGICESAATAQGLPWAAHVPYTDVGFSRDDLARPEYLKLIRETQAGDTILIWERSRLGVDLDYAIAVRDLVQRRGARVIVASGDPIDASDTGLVMEHMRGNADGGELRRIRSRTREKLRERVLRGYVGGDLPFGYETYPENPADPEKSWKRGRKVAAEEAIILRMAQLYVCGAGWLKIATILNREGVLPPGGGPKARKNRMTSGKWSHSMVWDILHCTLYRDGIYKFGTRGGKGGKFPPVSYHHPEWTIGDAELWARVDAAMKCRTTDMKGKIANQGKHTLSGVGRCAACLGALSIQTDGRPGKKVSDYLCSRHRRGRCKAKFRIRKAVLEDAIRIGLVDWFDLTRAAISEAAREIEARIAAQGAPDVAGIERELADARAEQARLVRLATATGGEVEAVVDALKSGQANVKRLEASLTRAQAPRADAALVARQIEREAVGRLDALRAALEGPDARDALHALFPSGLRILAKPDAFEVEGEGLQLTCGQPDGLPHVGCTPFKVTIPRRCAA